MKKNAITLTTIHILAIILTLSEQSFAGLKLTPTQPARCYMIQDERPDNEVFYFYKPQIITNETELILSGKLAYATCQKINDQLRFYPAPLANQLDKLIVQYPKGIFDVTTHLIAIPAQGHTTFNLSISLVEFLTETELLRFHKGQTIRKYFDIYFGRNINNNDSANILNYSRSSGKYILEFEINKAGALIISSQQTQNN